MGTITINGTTYQGNSIKITNGKVIVDGKEHVTNDKTIDITVEGDIHSIQADACNRINVKGKVGPVHTVSGDILIEGSVIGDVRTVSGNVKCGEVHGRIDTVSGNITHR